MHIENSSTSGYYTLFIAREEGTFMQRNHQWNKVCHLNSGVITEIWVAHSSVVEDSVKSLRMWQFIKVMLIDCSNPDCMLIGHLLTDLQVSYFLCHNPELLPQLPSTEYFKVDNFQ